MSTTGMSASTLGACVVVMDKRSILSEALTSPATKRLSVGQFVRLPLRPLITPPALRVERTTHAGIITAASAAGG
jgi:hypothetical protein